MLESDFESGTQKHGLDEAIELFCPSEVQGTVDRRSKKKRWKIKSDATRKVKQNIHIEGIIMISVSSHKYA